jgi:uncharacterized protein (TIGR01777 family)
VKFFEIKRVAMHVQIIGGTGMIGRALGRTLLGKDHAVWVLTRRDAVTGMPSAIRLSKWDGQTEIGWQDAAKWAHVIINLAGENIGAGRWTAERKEAIRQSRVRSGEAIVRAIRAGARPELLVQASAIGYYGVRSGGQSLDERTPAGDGFLAQTCVEWEESTRAVEEMGVRRAILRTGLVLDRSAGALKRMALPFRMFVGGRLGSGQQWYSWIHWRDEVNAICFLLEHRAQGVFNLTAPNPVPQEDFGRTLAKTLKRPYWFPAPEFVLKLVLGEMSTLVLDGQRVLPINLLRAGYQFQFSDLSNALQDLFAPSSKDRRSI